MASLQHHRYQVIQTIIWLAKASHQERFQQIQLELKNIKEQLRLLGTRRDNQDLCLTTVEMYYYLSSSAISHSSFCILVHDLTSRFFAVLHTRWFAENVQKPPM